MYFADDDNTYDIRLFDLMRFTRFVSVWPVGLIGANLYENINVKNSKVVGWHVKWRPERKFAIDMAGFAIHISLLHTHPIAQFSSSKLSGKMETNFLNQFDISLADLEPIAENFSHVLVWHTKALLPEELKYLPRPILQV